MIETKFTAQCWTPQCYWTTLVSNRDKICNQTLIEHLNATEESLFETALWGPMQQFTPIAVCSCLGCWKQQQTIKIEFDLAQILKHSWTLVSLAWQIIPFFKSCGLGWVNVVTRTDTIRKHKRLSWDYSIFFRQQRSYKNYLITSPARFIYLQPSAWWHGSSLHCTNFATTTIHIWLLQNVIGRIRTT